MPVNATKERIRTVELPALEKQIKTLDADLPSISEKAEQARNVSFCLFQIYLDFVQAADRLNDLKKEIKEVSSLKQSASTVSRNQSETERLKTEIGNLETELAATGTVKTGDDVQSELDVLSNEM